MQYRYRREENMAYILAWCWHTLGLPFGQVLAYLLADLGSPLADAINILTDLYGSVAEWLSRKTKGYFHIRRSGGLAPNFASKILVGAPNFAPKNINDEYPKFGPLNFRYDPKIGTFPQLCVLWWHNFPRFSSYLVNLAWPCSKFCLQIWCEVQAARLPYLEVPRWAGRLARKISGLIPDVGSFQNANVIGVFLNMMIVL